MKRDSQLARMMHLLIHMHLRGGRTTSETLALMLHSHPVAVRRTMAGLRDQGLVTSEGGHGGGWRLARGLEEITALNVFQALGRPGLIAAGPADDNPSCPVEGAVNLRLDQMFSAAEAALQKQLGELKLSEVAAQLRVGAET